MLLYLALGFGERTFEAYCPFGGAEALYGLFTTNNYTCALGEANMAMFFALIAMVVLSKKSFCGWICPIGAISEVLNRIGFKMRNKKHYLSERADKILRLLRYPVLIIVLYYTYKIGDLIFRGYDPFYLLFSGFGHGSLGLLSIVIISAVLLAGFFISMPFCRYFCPLGAFQDLLSWAGITKIYRNGETCTDCGICDRACPQLIPVSTKEKVKHIDCTNCLECIEVCPVRNCLEVRAF
jgi:polyferredoxin